MDTIVQSFDDLLSGHKWHFCVLLRRVNIFSSQIRAFCLLYHGSKIFQRNRGQYRSWDCETGEKLCFDGWQLCLCKKSEAAFKITVLWACCMLYNARTSTIGDSGAFACNACVASIPGSRFDSLHEVLLHVMQSLTMMK